ncbi:MAG: PKD domain-containing protein [Bacteroidota bacterium]
MKNRKILIALVFLLGWCFVDSFATTESKVENNPLHVSLSATTTDCANDANGTATATATGGKTPYSYKWSNSGTTATITNLVAGGYFVTVTDALGAEANSHVTVLATNQLQLTFDQSSIRCANQTDGKVVAIPQGGQAPYTYLWEDGTTSPTLTGIRPGMYMITVTDANGCRAEQGVMVMEPDPLRLRANYVHVSCGEEADAYMEVIASGGVEPYSFVWELDGKGGTRRENLKPGLYSVTVTDANGCTNMICPEIKQATPPLLSVTTQPETCPGEGDGRAYISAVGDSPPYTYQWPNQETQFSFFTQLTNGTYVVTVTNFRNCSATVEFTVGQAGGGFGFIVDSDGIACGSGANGEASVVMTGGVAPFTFQWVNKTNSEVISSDSTVSILAPGGYEVLVTDANGCFGKRDVLIVEKPLPTVTATATVGKVCFGENTGEATATASGGEGDYTYSWSDGQIEATASNLGGGMYTVTVIDGNGCTATDEVIIEENSQLVINERVTNLLCNDIAGGEIVANVTGGTAPYNFLWSNGETTNDLRNIKAGTYFLTVTDSENCQIVKGINIDQPTPIVLVLTSENAADLTTSDGSATATASGGTAPYQYLWSNGDTTATASNLAAGTYQLTVTDANGCEAQTTVEVEATCTLMAAFSDVRPTSCAGNDGAINLAISGEKNGASYQWTNGATTSSLSGLTPDYYGVTVTDGTGCSVALGTFVNDACDCTQPVLEKVLTFEATCGESDGSISIEVQGNEVDFNYQWSMTNATGPKVEGLPAGSYNVTITNKENPVCQTVETINVGNTNVGPVIVLENNPEVCNGQKGSVVLVPSGLNYTWSDGGEGAVRDDLAAGEYLVTVTIPSIDSCMDILSIDIGSVSGLTLTPTFTRLPDCGLSNGTVTIDVAGGSGDYAYSWGGATANNLPAGTYNIEVTDNVSGCSESVLFTLLENTNALFITIDSLSNVSCAGRMDGKVSYSVAQPTDFDGIATVVITDGTGREFDENNLPKGDYCIVAKDENGCLIGQACFTITEPRFLQVDVTVIPKTCSVENTILLTSSGGNGQYTYNWADLDGTINPRDRREISNGTYSVVITDEAGCQIAVEAITIDGECFICSLEATAAIETIPECGLPNGAATIQVENVFGNLTYSWGDFPSRNDLTAGTYTVTVTDDFRGCETEVSFTLTEPDLPMEATISELIVCPESTGQLTYDLSNFRCFAQPVTATITDEAGNSYDENALPAFGNYIFVVKDADGVELNRQFFSVAGYEPIIFNADVLDEGCTTLGAIDLALSASEANYTVTWSDLSADNQTIDRTDLTEGTYTVSIIDNSGTGCSVTQSYVVGKADDISADLDSLTITCDNVPVQLDLVGEGLTSFNWTPANLVIAGQGTATPTVLVDNSQPTVTVEAANDFGCTVTKEVKVVSVQTNPPGGIATSPQCDGLSIDFSSEGVASEYYLWDFGDGTTSDAVNPSHVYSEAGDYTVQLRLKPEVPCADEKGVIASRELNLVAEAKTEAKFDIDYDACQDEGLVSFKDASVVNPGTISSWNWDFGNGRTSNEQNPSILLTEGENLEVTLEIETTAGCGSAASETQSFAVVNLPKISEALQICPGVPTELNPNGQSGVTYEWAPANVLDNPNIANPTATTSEPTEFTVTITQGECVRVNTLQANVPAEQKFELSEDQEVCDAEARPISVAAPDNSTIEWTNSQTGEVLGDAAEILVSPGEYQVKLTDENDCPVTGLVAIDNYEINALIDNNTDPCEGGMGDLTVIDNGVVVSSYKWEDNMGIISADLKAPTVEVDPAATTDFNVTVRNEFGCEATLTQTVGVSMLDDMLLVAERDTIFKGEMTTINLTPEEEGDYTVEWTPSSSLDGASGVLRTAMPEQTTTYQVRITDNETGCSVTKEVTIFVKDVICDFPNIFFPNAFTPNGDGQNDVLYVRGNAISEVYFAVYNRWGEKVFESNSIDVGWDGTFEGEVVSTDVYGYYLKVTCLTGDVFETQGNVTVLN